MGQSSQNNKISIDYREWWLPLWLSLTAIAISLLGEEAAELLRYQRSELQTGEWWRVVSGHFVHLGWSHLWLNLAGLLLVWALVKHAFSALSWWGLIVFSQIGISLGLWWWLPQLDWYVGLSGLLHGMLLAGSLQLALRGDREMWLLLLVVIAKLAWELLQGPMPGSREAAGGNVIVEAHSLGGLVGALYALTLSGWAHCRNG